MFKPKFINANDLNDAYFTLLTEVWNNGRRYKIDTGSFAGSERLEFDYCSGFIRNPHQRPLSPIMPPGIGPVTSDEVIDQYFANYLMDPKLEKNEHYRYASWLNGIDHYKECMFYNTDDQQYKSIDDYLDLYWIDGNFKTIKTQIGEFIKITETPIEWVIRHFKEKGYGNNHCYINIGNVDSGFNYDSSYEHEEERRTSPCFRGIDFKIKNDQLITSVVFRSWDLYAGFPENMGGFTLLNEYVAEQLPGVEPGPLAFSSAGLHLYSYQIEPVMQILRKGNGTGYQNWGNGD